MSTPTRRRASDLAPRILEIFDGCVHGRMSKRDFIHQASRYAALGVTGAMILDRLRPDHALAPQVTPDDPDVTAERVTYHSLEGHGTIRGLMARPANAEGPLPAVLVAHENRGSTPMSRAWCAARPRRDASPSAPTGSPRSAAIPAPTRRGARCRPRSTAPR